MTKVATEENKSATRVRGRRGKENVGVENRRKVGWEAARKGEGERYGLGGLAGNLLDGRV